MWQCERARGQCHTSCQAHQVMRMSFTALSWTRLLFKHLSRQFIVIVLYDALVLVLVDLLSRTCEVYIQYDCTQSLREMKRTSYEDVTHLVKSVGDIDCNYKSKENTKKTDRFNIKNLLNAMTCLGFMR